MCGSILLKAIALPALSLAVCLSASAQRVDNAEYFWDTDPGTGNGFPMAAEDGAFDAAVEGIFLNTITLPGIGAHVLGIRVKDPQNAWGPTFSATVIIDPSVVTAPEIHVGEAEFFWDTDPGEGNGTPMLAFDGNYNDALEAIQLTTASLPGDGVHVLHVRALDVNMAWSTPFRVVVEVLGGTVTFPEIHVSAAEYYVNVDPGMGNATPMLALDGGFDSALEAVVGGGIPAPVDAGVNVLWLRTRDVNNTWGPSFGIVVNIDTTIAGTVGLRDQEPPVAIRLAPNPTRMNEGFAVLLDRTVATIRVEVLDALGRKVIDRAAYGVRRVELPIAGAAAGVYQVGVYLDGIPHWQRLVVQ